MAMTKPLGTQIDFSSGDLSIDTNTLHIDSANNRVGIGTTNPTSALQVTGAVDGSPDAAGVHLGMAGNYASIEFAGTDGGYIDFTSANSTDQDGRIIYYHSDDSMRFNTATTERMRIDSSGNVKITQALGKYTIDTTGGTTAISNGGTVDFPSASGMLVANNHSNGHVTIWLCGGGSTTAVSSVGGQVGTFAYVSGIAGYRWTNNYGSTANFGMFFVRTRPTA